jgi:PAS domain S-box-containing protein
VARMSSELADESPALQMLFTTLMNAVDEAVRIDDLTEFDKQLRAFLADGKQDLKSWLAQDKEAVARLRGTVVALDVNQATVDLFGADSVEQLLDYMNNTQVNVESPDIAKFAAALLSGKSGLTWTVFRRDIIGQLMSGAMESRFIRLEDRVLACHVIRRKKTVRELKVELSKMRQLHSLAVGATDTGCWEVAIKEGRMSIDATCHKLLGYDPGELPTTATGLIPMLHPDNRAQSVAMAERLHAGLSDEYRVENRIRDKSGNWRWFLIHGRAIESLASGQAAHIVGTLRQIDVPRKTEELLRIERQAFAMQAARNPLRETLTHLCLRLEEVWPETRCSPRSCRTPHSLSNRTITSRRLLSEARRF